VCFTPRRRCSRLGAPVSSRGTLRPFCIDGVFLFDARHLHAELGARGVKIGIATSVPAARWEAAEIYPHPNNPHLMVGEARRHQTRNVRL